MSIKNIIAAGLQSFIVAGCSLFGSSIEEPSFTVLKKDNEFETRKYETFITAETYANGEREKAAGDGFQVLAEYIFGGNKEEEKIDMTAPVMMELVDQKTQKWKISFVMPSKYKTISDLPKPNSSQITFIQNKPQKYIVLVFSGSTSSDNVDSNNQLMLDYLKKNSISTNNSSIYAFYNPPWTIPSFKRNEIMQKIK